MADELAVNTNNNSGEEDPSAPTTPLPRYIL